MSAVRHLGVLSLEPWDEVWRRNQHLASRLVRMGAVERITFVGPPRRGLTVRAARRPGEPGIDAVVPPLVVPRSAPGGYRVLGRWLRWTLADADALWINDAGAGVCALRAGVTAVHDVTDDWREAGQTDVDRVRTVSAEDVLAHRARTVVCSDVLAARWRDRYGVEATIVRNGVDLAGINNARPARLPGRAPHAVYVGTLHANRIDIGLVLQLASRWPGTLHLVGPIGLDDDTVASLTAAGARLPGPVPGGDVASWLVSADVLICPHMVDRFTLSLDAIKAHEYLATDRPVVATPTGGFQAQSVPGVAVVAAGAFVGAVLRAVGTGPFARNVAVDWSVRAAEFAAVLLQDDG